MSTITGSAVHGDRTLARFLVGAFLCVCGVGVFAYTNGLAASASVDAGTQPAGFAAVRHVPTRSGTQVPPAPSFHSAPPLTAAYITGVVSYPIGWTSTSGADESGLYVCATAVNASSLYCAHPDAAIRCPTARSIFPLPCRAARTTCTQPCPTESTRRSMKALLVATRSFRLPWKRGRWCGRCAV